MSINRTEEKVKNSMENAEKWENRELGASEEHVEAVDFSQVIEDTLNAATRMKPISIRLEEELLEQLKFIASHHGLGYQPLIRQLLKRFVKAELKVIEERMKAMTIKGPHSEQESDDHVDDDYGLAQEA
ncbi:CopG family antitoxin [Aliidiomarina quisquiliarum]|uniref:CopG family antitoxin n=1 Tax=Aliidiomarina quisquiliarum TaxID=2938947 RepID=UPI00208E5FFF|nr:CopG family antitoxin [Aliidiomarina quisquiliarum]MCO4320368.1 CopG family antitoxin [Aliidiomarina quisquiliarum]